MALAAIPARALWTRALAAIPDSARRALLLWVLLLRVLLLRVLLLGVLLLGVLLLGVLSLLVSLLAFLELL